MTRMGVAFRRDFLKAGLDADQMKAKWQESDEFRAWFAGYINARSGHADSLETQRIMHNLMRELGYTTQIAPLEETK